VALAENALEVYNVPLRSHSKVVPEPTRVHSVDLPGHRTDVRTLSLSSDDLLLASASNGESCIPRRTAYRSKSKF
jgi:U3 small nucleolar RNA-associated protein 12